MISKQDEDGKHRDMLKVILKSGCTFVEAFLRGEEFLTHLALQPYLQKRTLDAVSILQKATRQLQHLCAHAKASYEKVLIKDAPKLKSSLRGYLFHQAGGSYMQN